MTEQPRGGNSRLLDLLFFTGFALLMCHELDAVAQAEWRLLPGLSALEDGVARTTFIGLHIPLIALAMWGAASRVERVRRRVHQGMDIFMVAHAGLHVLFSGHEHYTFDSSLSLGCIFGAGVVGLVHATLVYGRTR